MIDQHAHVGAVNNSVAGKVVWREDFDVEMFFLIHSHTIPEARNSKDKFVKVNWRVGLNLNIKGIRNRAD